MSRRKSGHRCRASETPPAFAGRGERLTRAAPGPDFFVLGPTGELESERPSADASECVELPNAFKISSSQFLDRSAIYFSSGDLPVKHQVEKPLVRVRFDLVIKMKAHKSPSGDGVKVTMQTPNGGLSPLTGRTMPGG